MVTAVVRNNATKSMRTNIQEGQVYTPSGVMGWMMSGMLRHVFNKQLRAGLADIKRALEAKPQEGIEVQNPIFLIGNKILDRTVINC